MNVIVQAKRSISLTLFFSYFCVSVQIAGGYLCFSNVGLVHCRGRRLRLFHFSFRGHGCRRFFICVFLSSVYVPYKHFVHIVIFDMIIIMTLLPRWPTISYVV